MFIASIFPKHEKVEASSVDTSHRAHQLEPVGVAVLRSEAPGGGEALLEGGLLSQPSLLSLVEQAVSVAGRRLPTTGHPENKGDVKY